MSQVMDRRVSPTCHLGSVDRISVGGVIAADDPCSPVRYRHRVRHRRFKAGRPVLARLMKLAAMTLAVLIAPHDGHRSGGQLHLIRADQLLADRILARAFNSGIGHRPRLLLARTSRMASSRTGTTASVAPANSRSTWLRFSGIGAAMACASRAVLGAQSVGSSHGLSPLHLVLPNHELSQPACVVARTVSSAEPGPPSQQRVAGLRLS
jgi:hypothetical protein